MKELSAQTFCWNILIEKGQELLQKWSEQTAVMIWESA